MSRIVLSLCLTAFAVCVIACGGGTPPRGSTKPGAPPAADAETQQKRRQLIDKLIAENVIKDVDLSRKAVIVTPRFKTLDFDMKKKFMSMVAAYVFDIPTGTGMQPGEVLLLIDSKTGKTVGTYANSELDLD